MNNSNEFQVHKYLDLRVDWAFKYVFSKKEILLKLLNDILPPTITDLSYLPNEIPVMSEKDKRSTLDVICSSPEGTFLVEMQRRHEGDMDDRLAYYAATLIQRQVQRKDAVYNVKKVFVLCVASYMRNHIPATPKDKVLFSYDQRENETFELYDRSKTSFYFLELSRMREKDWSRLQKNPERWCYLFKNMANFADERDLPGDLHGFEEVLEASRFDTLSPEDMTIYELNAAKEHELLSSNMYQYNKGLQEGMEKGIKQGIEKGIEQERLSNARKFKALGIDPDIICQATGLSAEEVAAL